MFTLEKQPEIQALEVEVNPNEVRLFIKREDLIHPIISGNKWRKLKYNLEAAQKSNHNTILTFGGAYSNHIYAVAGAANQYGFKSIGIIRGEEHLPLNPTLRQSSEMGMSLHYIDRTTYRNKHEKIVLDELGHKFGEFYLIPEGGTNELAVKGAAEIVEGLKTKFDYFVTPCGTGGTISGVICGLEDQSRSLGISVLKGDFHSTDVRRWLNIVGDGRLKNWEINTDYHFGGYAKFDNSLIDFINAFKQKYRIQLDPIYTGKMMFAIFDMIAKGQFMAKSRVLAIHTGGIQGISGFNQRFNNQIII